MHRKAEQGEHRGGAEVEERAERGCRPKCVSLTPPPGAQCAACFIAALLAKASGEGRREQVFRIMAGDERTRHPVHHGAVLQQVMT
jgi:hypothetical protein